MPLLAFLLGRLLVRARLVGVGIALLLSAACFLFSDPLVSLGTIWALLY